MPPTCREIGVSARTLRVLKVLAENPAAKRTVKGVTNAMAAVYPDADMTEYKIRTLEAESFITSHVFDEVTVYGPGPLLPQLAFKFFGSERQVLEASMIRCQQALAQLPIGDSSGK